MVCEGHRGTAIIEDWSLRGRIVAPNHESEKIEPTPIRAGVGLTKTMAPPSEGSTVLEDLPAALEMPSSFYDNLAAVIEGTAEPIVKNAEVLRVLKLIEAIFEAAERNETIKNFDNYGA